MPFALPIIKGKLLQWAGHVIQMGPDRRVCKIYKGSIRLICVRPNADSMMRWKQIARKWASKNGIIVRRKSMEYVDINILGFAACHDHFNISAHIA